MMSNCSSILIYSPINKKLNKNKYKSMFQLEIAPTYNFRSFYLKKKLVSISVSPPIYWVIHLLLKLFLDTNFGL